MAALVAEMLERGADEETVQLRVCREHPKISTRTVKRYIKAYVPGESHSKSRALLDGSDFERQADAELPPLGYAYRAELSRPERVAAWAETARKLTEHAFDILEMAKPDESRMHGAAARLCNTAASYEGLIVKAQHWDKITPDYDLSSEEVQVEVTQALEQHLNHFPRHMLARIMNAATSALAAVPGPVLGGVKDEDGIA